VGNATLATVRPRGTQVTDERQKKTTEEYRSNWDSIFKKKPIEQPKQEKQNENTPRTNP
jgi:hypothetical protein